MYAKMCFILLHLENFTFYFNSERFKLDEIIPLTYLNSKKFINMLRYTIVNYMLQINYDMLLIC